MNRTLICTLCLAFSAGAVLSQSSYQFQHETLPCLNKRFTVVAHVFPDSLGNYNMTEAQIRAALPGVNKYFAPICAEFALCEVKFYPNFQYDTLETDNEINEMISKHHEDYRINFYFVQHFSEKGPVHCAVCAGSISSAFGGGIYFKKGCYGSGTAAHELGHFFGLAHTFAGSGTENVDGSNCATAGDGLCDTPADPYVDGDPMSDYLEGCKFISTKKDANGEYFNPDVGNIMSYYSCSGCGFTWEQLNRMANSYLQSAPKFW